MWQPSKLLLMNRKFWSFTYLGHILKWPDPLIASEQHNQKSKLLRRFDKQWYVNNAMICHKDKTVHFWCWYYLADLMICYSIVIIIINSSPFLAGKIPKTSDGQCRRCEQRSIEIIQIIHIWFQSYKDTWRARWAKILHK